MLCSHHQYARLEQQTWAQTQEQTGWCCCSEPASCSLACKRAVLRAQPSPALSPVCPSHGFPLATRSHPSALSVSHHCGSFAKQHSLCFLHWNFSGHLCPCRDSLCPAGILLVGDSSLATLVFCISLWKAFWATVCRKAALPSKL